MTLIDWKDEFSLGIAAVDLEHRGLIDLINEVHAGMLRDATVERVLEGLGDIYAQIAAHFALEEKYMRELRYPAFESHKEDHEKLLDELRDIMDRVEDDGEYDDERLARELEQWFTEHFRTHDARLHRHA